MSVVLVTGGAGYVGSHAVLALAAAGYDVVVFDDLSAGHPEAVERIRRAFPARSITLVEGDILDRPLVLKTLADVARGDGHALCREAPGRRVRRAAV